MMTNHLTQPDGSPSPLGVEDHILQAIRRMTRALDLHSRSLLVSRGLTAPQIAVLRAIGRRKEVSGGVLAREVHLSHATVTGILTRLESRGYITRCRAGSDRRSVMVCLTDAGRKVLAECPPLMHERFRSELAKLPSWEQTHILAMLQRVASMMEVSSSRQPEGAGVVPEGEDGTFVLGVPEPAATAAESGEQHPADDWPEPSIPNVKLP